MDLKEVDKTNANRHPWETARDASILSLIPGGLSRAADIGAGDLYFTRMLAGKTGTAVFAADINYDRCGQNGNIVMCRDLENIPAESLELITLMDVLEHVEDDRGFLGRVVSRLKPGGRLIVTVPAHQYLFSEHDEFLKHYRRYGRRNFLELLSETGLRVDTVFHFFISLYFVRLLQLILKRAGLIGRVSVGVGGWPYSSAHFFTRLSETVLKLDFFVCRRLSRIRISMPGLSLCAVCAKK